VFLWGGVACIWYKRAWVWITTNDVLSSLIFLKTEELWPGKRCVCMKEKKKKIELSTKGNEIGNYAEKIK